MGIDDAILLGVAVGSLLTGVAIWFVRIELERRAFMREMREESRASLVEKTPRMKLSKLHRLAALTKRKK